MKMRDKVAIGWIDPGTVDGLFCLSLMQIYYERANIIESAIRVENRGLISRGRNEVVARFLDHTDAQWLLMIDADEALDVASFDRLLAAAHDIERPIVAGLYFGMWPPSEGGSWGGRWPEPMPLIFKQRPDSMRFVPVLNYPDNEVIEIDSAGTGCLLVHRSVMEKMRAEATPHQGRNWAWFMDCPINGDWFSEDHWFCQRAKQMGYRLHAHTGVILQHRKSLWLGAQQYVKPDLEAIAKEMASSGVQQLQQPASSDEPVSRLRIRDDRKAADSRDDGAQASGTQGDGEVTADA